MYELRNCGANSYQLAEQAAVQTQFAPTPFQGICIWRHNGDVNTNRKAEDNKPSKYSKLIQYYVVSVQNLHRRCAADMKLSTSSYAPSVFWFRKWWRMWVGLAQSV